MRFLLALVLCLPFSALAGESVPAGPELAVYQQALTQFNSYRNAKISTISHSKHGPVLLEHGQKTEYVIVLFHGLYESPRSMRGIAREFHAKGMNVLMPLLPGHWQKNYKLADKITYADWLAEVDVSMSLAQKLGQKVLVGGFSLGGDLATLTAIKYPQVRGLYLWAPAFGLSGGAGLAAGLGGGLGIDGNRDYPWDGVNVPYYSLKMARQIIYLNTFINKRILGFSPDPGSPNPGNLNTAALAGKIKVPTFLSYSNADEAISLVKVKTFYKFLRVKKTLAEFTGIKHTGSAKDRSDASPIYPNDFNPSFENMMRDLSDFINQCH